MLREGNKRCEGPLDEGPLDEGCEQRGLWTTRVCDEGLATKFQLRSRNKIFDFPIKK